MSFDIRKPMTDTDAAAELRRIFDDLQTRFYDQWDWLDAEFSLQVIEGHLCDARDERDKVLLQVGDTVLVKSHPEITSRIVRVIERYELTGGSVFDRDELAEHPTNEPE
jgi:hypothetical protein